ncbi:hypothetical protein GR268_45000, partial [Rhizobium leguminosarum]|nr:hypothetical protein [Rhizobium leguminosarum]
MFNILPMKIVIQEEDELKTEKSGADHLDYHQARRKERITLPGLPPASARLPGEQKMEELPDEVTLLMLAH